MISNQVVEEWPFVVYSVRELEGLVDLEKGPVDWEKINESWVVSHDLIAEVCIITVKNGIVTRRYDDETIIEKTTYDYDIQLEVHETKQFNYCVDVISYFGDTLEGLTLVERLAKVTSEIAEDLELSCHQYYAYNEDTIKKINKYNVINFIIQNILDPYNSTRKRLVTIQINNQDIKDEEYDSTNILEQKETKLQVRDIQETKKVKEVECPESWIRPVPISGELLQQSYMLRKKQWRVKLPYIYARSNLTGRKLKYELKLLRIDMIRENLERKGNFLVIEKGYDVADRVLEKST